MEKLCVSVKNYIALHETGHLIFGILEMLEAGLSEDQVKKGTILIYKEENPEGEEHGSFVGFDRDNRKLLSPLTYLAGSFCALRYLELITPEDIQKMTKEEILETMTKIGGKDDIDRGRLRSANESDIKTKINKIISITDRSNFILTKIATDALTTGKVCGGRLNSVLGAMKKINKLEN